MPALVILLGLLVAGSTGLYFAFSQQAPERAVTGSPGSGSIPPPAEGSAATPEHPQIEMPPEIIKFLDELAQAATRAPDDIEAWRKLARARYRAGMLNRKYYVAASEAVDHILGLQPNDAEAIRMAGNIAYESERFADAEKLFVRYLALDPKDPGVRTDLASAILFQGRNDEARKMYGDVITSNPDFVEAHVNLGIALHGAGDRELAMSEFKRARELAKDPDQRERIESIIAAAEGRAQTAPSEAAMGSAPTEGGRAGAPVAAASNAGSEFQRAVDRVFTDHPIVAPKISNIDWQQSAVAALHLSGFPMDKMPPVVRNKFKSTVNAKIAALAKQYGVAGPVRVDMVDADSGRVMDSLDGKELIGAFDEPRDR